MSRDMLAEQLRSARDVRITFGDLILSRMSPVTTWGVHRNGSLIGYLMVRPDDFAVSYADATQPDGRATDPEALLREMF